MCYLVNVSYKSVVINRFMTLRKLKKKIKNRADSSGNGTRRGITMQRIKTIGAAADPKRWARLFVIINIILYRCSSRYL